MRRLLIAAAVLLAVAPPTHAQGRSDSVTTVGTLPRGVAREAAEVYNADETLRSLGAYTVDSGEVVERDLAVVDGPLVVAGHLTGRLVAINADVTLRPGARVDGDVLVVGGTLQGRDEAVLGGDVRVYSTRLAYREVDDRIIPAGAEGAEAQQALEDWWERWRDRRSRTGSRLLLVTGKTYDRVEGLPILAGPSFRGRYHWGELRADALGILRTADGAHWDSENLGHQLRTEIRLGQGHGTLFGGELYDVVRPVEDWQLSDAEVGLASFFLHRDYRDYYNAHGGAIYAGLFAGADADVTLRFADERWGSRRERDPLSLFRNGELWRANPAADEGAFHLANATLRVDTRNVTDRPWSGWYIVADYEYGRGRARSLATLSPGVRDGADPEIAYGRGFLDLRRYSRIAPGAQLNLRAVAGGWLHGDPLPAQRRLSVGGPGSLPGFDFRSRVGEADVGQCSTVAPPLGQPAECDRVLLFQAEYRGDLRLSLGLDDVLDLRDGNFPRSEWVAFANTGRGWLVGEPPAVLADHAALWTSRGSLPSLSSFRTDVGFGLDLGVLGVFVAKAVSEPGQPANFYIRLRDRF
ncbi:MAG TPA: polymer-forming cytoskeletal protein [Gemmatimonadaceae bacterium]|nr:polymer-forming cytoskeletal protein [Gemmatimonadaceae bacterium]